MSRYGDTGPAGKVKGIEGEIIKKEKLRKNREVLMSLLLDIPKIETKWWNKYVLKIARNVDRTRKAVVRVRMDTFLGVETAGF